MQRVFIRPHWKIGPTGDSAFDTNQLLQLLAAVQDTGAIAQAARSVDLSYRHAWGLIKRAEALFGGALLDSGRGRGSVLTPLGSKLIWADKRISARLSPLLESLASELEGELERALAQAGGVLRLNASHGFAVATLLEHLGRAQLPVELRYRNSLESMAALARGDCDLAGFHVPLGEFEARAAQRFLRWLQPAQHSLVHLAVRSQGLFVAAGNPLGIRGVADLRRPQVRFVNRPEGSGTRVLTELLLQQAGIAPHEVRGFESAEFTHAAVAAFIASGMADVGLGVQTAAQRFGLEFVPLVRERYFFALRSDALADAPVAAVVRLLQSAPYRSAVAALPGYDTARTGQILSLQEAFGS